MHGINSEPFLCLDEFIDVETFSSLHEKISYGISCSEILWAELGSLGLPEEQRFSASIERKKLKGKSTYVAQKYSELDASRGALFLSLVKKSYAGLKFIPLRYPSGEDDWFSKHHAVNFSDHPNYEFFPELRMIVNQLPFQEVGRVIIYLNDGDSFCPIHRDIQPSDLDVRGLNFHDHEFIWIRPNMDRKFFVYDEKSREKFYLEGRSVFFNELDFHGTDACHNTTYAIRIDGRFSDEFRREVGLEGNYC